MANTVFKLRRSSVAGKQPNTSTLAIGELALNLTDRKLYSSDGTNVWETGANLTTLNVSTNSTVNNVIFSGGIYSNGSYGVAGQYLTSNGSGIYWSTSTGGGGGILEVRYQFVGDGSTDTFVVPGGYESNSLSVFLNGILLHNGTEANVLSGGTFSLTTPPPAGSLIDIVGISTRYANGINTVVSQQFTANGTSNSFTITDGYIPNKIQVYLNGVKQVPGSDVDISSGSTVNFYTTPSNSYIVDVFGFQTGIVASTVTDSNSIYVWTNTHTFTNNVTFSRGISANGGFGTSGQALTTNGSAVYWSTIVGTNTDAQYVWSNNHTFNANVNVNAALIANGTAGIATQVLTTNGSGVYWSSAGVNTAAQYTWTNTQTFSNTITFNSVINGTANAANYLGGNSASDLRNYSDSKAATAYSNAVSYTDGKILTANSAITGNAATAYTNAVSYTDSKILTANSAITGNAATAYTNAVSYVDGKSYVNTSQLTNNLSNYALLSGATFTGNVVANNANTTYDLNVGRNLTVAGNLTITGNVTIIGANNLSIVDNFIYLNSNNTTQNVDLGWAGNYNDGVYHHAGFFRDATDGVWKVFDNYLPEPDANVNIDTTNTSFHIANFQANVVYIGNTSVYSTVNTTNFSGTSNSTLYVIANDGIVSNSSGVFVKAGTGIAVNSTGVHATTGVNTDSQYTWSNVQTFNANLVIGTSSQIIANGSFGTNGQVIVSNGTGVYWSNAYTTGTRQNFTGTGACTTFTISGGYVPHQADVYVNGVKISNATADISSGSTVVFSSAPSNGSEIQVVGIQPILYTFANTSAQYVWTNTQTFSNLVMISSAGISANGSYGTNGQVLTSNGTSVFWSNSATYVRQTFTGTGACTTFQVTGGYTPNNLDVYVTGVKQLSTTDVDISSGNNIVFTIAPTNNAPIEVVGVIPLLYSYANQTYSYTWTNTHTFSNGTATATVNASVISIGNSSVNTQIVAGNVFLNGSTLIIGNTASNITINSTAISVGTVQLNTTSFAGTANNTSFVGTVSAANVVSNAQLSSNLANYTTTTNLTNNLANYTTTTNLTNNLANYQTTAGLSANVATLTSNNSTYAFGKTEGNLNVNSSVYSNSSSTNTFTIGTAAYHVANGNFGIGTSSPAVSLDLSSKTDSIAIPSGTTAQRPASAANGYLRFNSTLNCLECYSSNVNLWMAVVDFTAPPSAPTIGTATATGTTTATVSFTAPTNTGQLTSSQQITSYTAVSSPGGITGTLSQSGSGTITVTGLSPGTSYTFTVYATNALGNSPSSGSSNSITTQISVNYAIVGGGGGGGSGATGGNYGDGGGGGGSGGYSTGATVVAPGSGTTYTVTVGGGGGGNGSPATGCDGNGGSGSGGSSSSVFGVSAAGGGAGNGGINGGTGGSGGTAGSGGNNGTSGVGSPGGPCNSTTPASGGTGGNSPYTSSGGGTAGAGGCSVAGGNGTSYGAGGGGGQGGKCCGGGIGSGCNAGRGGNGATGVVAISYSSSYPDATSTTGAPTYTNSGGTKTYLFTGGGSITW